MSQTNSAVTRDRRHDGHWWKSAVVYQLYLPSFADADGDGLGDLPGATARIDHLARLGLDAVWLSPFYVSPMIDGGYDVADPRGVDPRFGTLADFDAFVQSAHALDMKVIVDVVPNHTSSEHPWFREALAAPPGSAARNRYFFRDGRGLHGEEPPNNWPSTFGGSAWTRLPDGQWYMHTFDAAQPELNWDDQSVRDDFETTLCFWLERGVDGIRIDVAHGMVKPAGLPDLTAPLADLLLSGSPDPRRDVDGVHDVHRWIRSIVDRYPGRMTVGEVWIRNRDRLRKYLDPGELHSVFDLGLIWAAWGATELRGAIDAALTTVAGTSAPASWVLSNHDVVRHVTRYGDGAVGVRRARAAALLQFALPGIAYVYTGDELGLSSVDPPDEAKRDPAWRRDGRGRDNCRLPMPWAGNEPPYGFSENAQTWLPAPAGWGTVSVAQQENDSASMLALYRSAICGRVAFGDAPLAWLDAPPDVLAFERGVMQCIINTGNSAVPLPPGRVCLSSVGPLSGELPGDAAVWLRRG